MACVKVHVDQDLCTACSLCYERLPEVFQDAGDGIATVAPTTRVVSAITLTKLKRWPTSAPLPALSLKKLRAANPLYPPGGFFI